MPVPKTRDGNLTMDDLLEPFFEFRLPRWELPSTTTPVDVYEKDGKYVLEAAVPGFEPKEINVEVTGNTISISGKHVESSEKHGVRYHRREMRRDSFSRSATLPQDLDANAVDAKIDKGVLTVTVTPVKPLAPKKIEVKAANGAA